MEPSDQFSLAGNARRGEHRSASGRPLTDRFAGGRVTPGWNRIRAWRGVHLTGIAGPLADQFTSRNDDIGGYWGLVVLRREADDHGVATMEFDLLSPHDPIAARYSAELQRHVATESLTAFVRQAWLRIDSTVLADARWAV